MTFRYVLIFVLAATTALAKDITLPLTDQEQAALRELLDVATKAGGLAVAPAAIHFAEKIKMYQLQGEKPAPPPSAPRQPE